MNNLEEYLRDRIIKRAGAAPLGTFFSNLKRTQQGYMQGLQSLMGGQKPEQLPLTAAPLSTSTIPQINLPSLASLRAPAPPVPMKPMPLPTPVPPVELNPLQTVQKSLKRVNMLSQALEGKRASTASDTLAAAIGGEDVLDERLRTILSAKKQPSLLERFGPAAALGLLGAGAGYGLPALMGYDSSGRQLGALLGAMSGSATGYLAREPIVDFVKKLLNRDINDRYI